MWRAKPLIIEVEGSPVTIKFSSLRAYQFSLGLVALSLVLAGWLFGSGLLALKAMFSPSVEISRSAGGTLRQWEQGSLKTGTTSHNSAERWTTMSSGYAGTNRMGIHTGQKGERHE